MRLLQSVDDRQGQFDGFEFEQTDGLGQMLQLLDAVDGRLVQHVMARGFQYAYGADLALSNQDVALATSGGLAFFLVAVVLDRMSQRESDDLGGDLFHRIRQAWAHRRNPEELLADDAEAGAGIKFETSGN